MTRMVILSGGTMLIGETDTEPDEYVVLRHPAAYIISPVPAQHPVSRQMTLGSAGILHFLGVGELSIACSAILAISDATGVDLDMYESALSRRRNEPGKVVRA